MKYCEKKFSKFFNLSGSNCICFLWYHLFINNRVKWYVSSVLFKIKCRLMGVKYSHIRCYGKVDLYRAPKSNILLGNNISITSSSSRGNACSLYSHARLRTLTPSALISIGDETGLNGVSITARSKSISIGNNCRIGPNVVIVDSDFHAIMPPDERVNNPGFEYDCDVHINQNVWIGMNTIILKGVTIGKNSVIGAGSIVTKDVEANCLAAGVPASKIKKLV